MQKPPLYVVGMLGIGDCIKQRAVVRELMKTWTVTLKTFYVAMYHDLIAEGLSIQLLPNGRIKDPMTRGFKSAPQPRGALTKTITYGPARIKQHGSILAAQFASVGLKMPDKPDFSFPVPDAWRKLARDLEATWNKNGKPLMVYRPIVLNNFWRAPSRSPDPDAYGKLFQSIREQFFVVSIAHLGNHGEYIVGEQASADARLHGGELDFCVMAGMYANAALAFGNAGFSPVIAQAVGTPNICVYGGNESFRTTNSVGAHLAPTLAIEPIKPCECHNQKHDCDKTIDMPTALDRVGAFAAMYGYSEKSEHTCRAFDANINRSGHPFRPGVTMTEGELVEALAQSYGDHVKAPLPGLEALGQAMYAPGDTGSEPASNEVEKTDRPNQIKAIPTGSEPRVLIFGTSYVDTADAMNRLKDWVSVHKRLNPDCDLLIIDSASPLLQSRHGELTNWRGVDVFQFTDNIGHLAKGGRDGWGRAFCEGLERATYDLQPGGPYDVVVHIECDSLFARPVMPIAKDMMRHGVKAMAPPVRGTKSPEPTFIETGLMFFRTDYLRASGFVEKYNWPDYKPKLYPKAPEYWVRKILGDDLDVAMPWLAARGDNGTITSEKVHIYDWVTHVKPEVWDAFANYLDPTDQEPTLRSGEKVKGLMLNLGCGENKLPAPWQNFDADVDITKRLPWPGASVDYALAEHVLEHVSTHEAIRFLMELRRVLKPGGVARIVVPSIEQVHRGATDEYLKWVFSKGWAPSATVRGALHAMAFKHGHQALWTQASLEAALMIAGFDNTRSHRPGESERDELRGIEGHGRIIGDAFNALETIAIEAW